MPIFSPSRCVLLLNDEGINIYDVSSAKVQAVDGVPWETVGFEDVVADIIRKKCRAKSVLIFNDMVEQHYRKERIPRASALDRANLIKRRGAAAFPSYPIRSAIKLKEKPAAKDASGQGGDIYLLAATPLSDNVRKTLAAVQKSYASLAGFCLLPVESAAMVHAISKKLGKVSEKPSVWTVFVGQHHNGGLRQIVTKNGELALTRMTPVVDSDANQDLWASEIAGELKGTMSYLSRFGFDARDGLDIIVVANNAAADKVAEKIDIECNLSVLTAIEVSNLLGIKIGRQEEQRYADPIHVAWTGRKSKFVMPLQAAQIDNISNPTKITTAVSAALFLGCCYFGYTAFMQASAWTKNAEQLNVAQQTLESVRGEHTIEVEKAKAAGLDFLLVENSTKAYERLEKGAMKPLDTFDRVGRALGPDIRITSLTIKPTLSASTEGSQQGAPAVDPNAPAVQREYDLVLRFVFPSNLAPETGVRKINELEKRLKENLPNHRVSIVKQVADLSYTGNFVGESGGQGTATNNGEKKDYEAQILIRGAML